MLVKNRMAQVKELRCHACQDYMEMVLVSGWQKRLYVIAERAINENQPYRLMYSHAYRTMRENGVEAYSAKKMDITLMTGILLYCNDIAPYASGMRPYIVELQDDRNADSHTDENETPEDLYLAGILSLYKLKKFVRAVDEKETGVDDDRRKEYLQRYVKAIDALMKTLDEERIELLQMYKEIDKDIKIILTTNDSDAAWYRMYEVCFNRYITHLKDQNEVRRFQEFFIRASDAGIANAHPDAVVYCLEKDEVNQADQKLKLIHSLTPGEADKILRGINQYVGRTSNRNAKELEEMAAAVGKKIEDKRYTVVKDNGHYQMKKV